MPFLLTFGAVFSKNSLFQKDLRFGVCSISTGLVTVYFGLFENNLV